MPIYRVTHADHMGYAISEQFFDSKNKAKKALRKKFKELKPNIEMDVDFTCLSEPVVHKKQLNVGKKALRVTN